MIHRSRAVVAVMLTAVAALAFAQTAGRLIEDLNVSERPDHIDISLQFTCNLQYRGQMGTAPTDVVRIRFAPGADCGSLGGSLATAAPGDAARYVRSLTWDQLTGQELTLTVQLAAKQDFLVAPAAEGRGIRLRLLRSPESRAHISVGGIAGPSTSYAVNLDSSLSPYDEAAIARASAALGNLPVYVSTYQLPGPVEEQTWYRLRAGPFAARADAENLLRTARAAFPKAWLAIGDETQLDDGQAADHAPAAPAAGAAPASGAATLTATEATTLLEQARKDFTRKNYTEAIPLLTRLLEQPEFPQRADAQELMGLARERNRQLAHAKADYEEYLRRYPQGPAVKRVRERLRALALATRAPGVSASAFGAADGTWKVYGGFGQFYRHDNNHFAAGDVSSDVVSQNALFNDVDTVARRRGERFDFTARLSADYMKNMLADGLGDRTRVSNLFVDLVDRQYDWSARLGRQTQTTGGLFGSFDGMSGGWQLLPQLRLKVAAGYPVELASDAPDTGRRFVALAGDIGTFGRAWDLSLYALTQQLGQLVDRNVVGTELKYFQPERTLVALLDYDLHFHVLNDAFVLGTLRLPDRWTLSANLDRRRSPTLGLRNALIGQATDSFADLSSMFTRPELERMAVDRSAESALYDVSVARPFGERWQWSLDVSTFSLGATPASGGVAAMPASGTQTAITLQGLAFSLFGGGDLSTVALRNQNGAKQNVESAGISTRFPLWGKLRLGPSLRVDRRELHADQSQQWLYVPGLRLDLLGSRFILNLEAGAEIGRRQLVDSTQNSGRYYFGLGYRMNF